MSSPAQTRRILLLEPAPNSDLIIAELSDVAAVDLVKYERDFQGAIDAHLRNGQTWPSAIVLSATSAWRSSVGAPVGEPVLSRPGYPYLETGFRCHDYAADRDGGKPCPMVLYTAIPEADLKSGLESRPELHYLQKQDEGHRPLKDHLLQVWTR